MSRLAAGLLLLGVTLFAATSKLYLKDGTYQLVREYKVVNDRVRYYSVERSDWEEIPLDLIDMNRTEAEVKERGESRRKEAAEMAVEEKVEREQEREGERVPQDPGVYLAQGSELKALPRAECKVVNSKGRSALKVLSPIPMVAGKATVEVDGARSKNVAPIPRPEFYMRLAQEERFGIFKLTPHKDTRVVQQWSIMPMTKEITENQQEVAAFRKQLDDGLFKIWPEKPLDPGEYAVVEYTAGEKNIQVWDFRIENK
jgi:hypothetical protein